MGFTKTILQVGNGLKPKRGQSVTVHCTGMGKNRDFAQKFWVGEKSQKMDACASLFVCSFVHSFVNANVAHSLLLHFALSSPYSRPKIRDKNLLPLLLASDRVCET
jgi:hypothetical protein